MSGTIRTFLAFDIEDQTILRRIMQAQKMLVSTGADLKLVNPQNIHLTIRFLGEIPLTMIDQIYEEMKKLVFSPFQIELEGIGAFPKPAYPRVVWAGIRNGVKELKNVFEQLEPRLRGLGFQPDNKGFSPHLTIARVRSGRNKAKLAELINDLMDYDFGTVNSGHLKLIKSDLTPRGPIYTNVKEVSGNNVQ
ncbi:RNA 2',3'-cyclic phosphodiesterase [Candidatus Bathyarchaeota archaeon]|nr:RNA 2',3'-cyclic phosphodiesterase [Candidatus Bathyarchaeota archaeon]